MLWLLFQGALMSCLYGLRDVAPNLYSSQTLFSMDNNNDNCLFGFYTKCSLTFIVLSVSIILSACTSEVEKVCKVSDEDNLQPFKDKMDDFLAQGN